MGVACLRVNMPVDVNPYFFFVVVVFFFYFEQYYRE